MKRLAPVLGLFLLAPFVGEFLLGNLTLAELPLGILLAPLYGCGAIVVREVTRRSGRGWPTMVLLAAAYALIEEGPVDQLLWNDAYAGADLLHGASYLPGIGMSVELTLAIIALHTVWSICVPIAIVETFVPAERRTEPWLGVPGLLVVVAIYLLGAAFVFWGTYAEEQFLASPLQFGVAGILIVGLVVAAFRVPRRVRPAGTRPAPAPWVAGVFSLGATSLYWLSSVVLTADWQEWLGIALWFALAIAGIIAIGNWSARPGWSQAHVFALAAGATLTYAWSAFPTVPEGGGSPTIDLLGNTLFAVVAVVILLLAARRLRRPRPVDA